MKKMFNVYNNAILNFISVKYLKKGWCAIYIFCKTLAPWFWRIICPCSSWKISSSNIWSYTNVLELISFQKIFLNLEEKIKDNFFFAEIGKLHFDLWMSKGHMIYLLLSFISLDLIDNLKQMTIGQMKVVKVFVLIKSTKLDLKKYITWHKNMENSDRNGTRVVQILIFAQQNSIFQWRQGRF